MLQGPGKFLWDVERWDTGMLLFETPIYLQSVPSGCQDYYKIFKIIFTHNYKVAKELFVNNYLQIL